MAGETPRDSMFAPISANPGPRSIGRTGGACGAIGARGAAIGLGIRTWALAVGTRTEGDIVGEVTTEDLTAIVALAIGVARFAPGVGAISIFTPVC